MNKTYQESDWWDNKNFNFICPECKTILTCNISEGDYPSGVSLLCESCKALYVYTIYNNQFSLVSNKT